MRRALGLVVLLVGMAACAPATGGTGGGPTTKPVISAIVVTPDPVAQGASLTVGWHVADTAGVAGTTLVLRNTGSAAVITGCAATVHRTSGTALDGGYTATCPVPPLAPAGSYVVDVTAINNSGGSTENTATTFTVTGVAGDTSAPVVVTSSFVVTHPASGPLVTVSSHITDQSGVAALAFTLQNHTTHATVGFGSTTLVTGTALDGTYTTPITTIVTVPAGQYDVVLAASDILGNSASTTLGTVTLS